MGIETTRANRKGKEPCELPKEITNSNSKLRKSRRRQKKMSPVQTPPIQLSPVQMSPIQKLFETCKEVFACCGTGIIPSSEDIERLRAVLDEMKTEDVGLGPDMPFFRTLVPQRTPAITYLHLFESDKFSMGIFCLPPSGVIPLHNHPGMTVFSKLLFGTVHIKSYDWVVNVPSNASAVGNASQIAAPSVRLAKVKVDSNFIAPCNTSILYPADGGNMHCFTAETACAVLDVLGPPYSDPDGRHCTYYREYPFASFSDDGVSVPEEEKESHAWLQEREKLDDIAVVGAEYTGPEIVLT